MYEILCQCWQEGGVPRDIRDCTILTLYIKKHDPNDCENYNYFSPLRIVGKVFLQFTLIRFHKLAEIVYPESHVQYGFRTEYSTVGMVLNNTCSWNNTCPCASLILTSPRPSTGSAESALSRSCQRSDVHQISLHYLIHVHHMKGTVKFSRSTSQSFVSCSSDKLGCVLTPAHYIGTSSPPCSSVSLAL